MTIPQIITAFGWAVVVMSLTFIFEFEDFGVDQFLAPEMKLGIGIPGIVLGSMIVVGGLFGEHLHEKWIASQRDDQDDRYR